MFSCIMSSCTLAMFIYVNEIRLPFLLQDPGNELYLKSLELSAKVFYFNSFLSLLCFHYLILYCMYVSKLPFLFPFCCFQYRGLFFVILFENCNSIAHARAYGTHPHFCCSCVYVYMSVQKHALMNTRYMEDLL